MSKSDASATLQNVLDACDTKTSTKVDDIISKTPVSSFGYRNRIIIAAIILIVTILMPLVFSPTLKANTFRRDSANIAIAEYNIEDDTLYIALNGSFINIKSMYAVTSTGETVYPYKYDLWNEAVMFKYDDTEWNIYVEDTYGKTTHMLLTPLQ